MVDYIPHTDSTNTVIRKKLSEGALPHGYCVVTDYQTDGHGQATNRWESEKGKNLLFSVLLHPDVVKPSDQFVITEIVSLSIVEALQCEISDEIEIKWPNDIYVGNKKICGVLIENSLSGNTIIDSIIGIGVNINQSLFMSDAPNPVSLANISGRQHDRADILQRIYRSVLERYEMLAQDEGYRERLHSEYMSHLYRRSGLHLYRKADETVTFRAKIEKIDSFGLLYLLMEDGQIHSFAFKEVVQVIG